MEQLIIQQGKRHGRFSEFVKSSSTVLTLGRGLENDVILSDHFIAENQLQFNYDNGEWKLNILDDINPVLLNNKEVKGNNIKFNSGDHLTVGRTSLVLLLSNQPVERTRKLIISNWMSHPQYRYILPFMTLIAAVLLAIFTDYQASTAKIKWGQLASGSLIFGFMIILWAAGWALAGRLLKHKPNFLPQLYYTALFMVALDIAVLFSGYAEYITTSSVAGNVIESLFFVLLFGSVLKYNLTYATELQRRGTIAYSIVSLLMIFGLFMSYLGEREFSSQPDYSRTVKPPLAKWHSDSSLDEYMKGFEGQFVRLEKIKDKE